MILKIKPPTLYRRTFRLSQVCGQAIKLFLSTWPECVGYSGQDEMVGAISVTKSGIHPAPSSFPCTEVCLVTEPLPATARISTSSPKKEGSEYNVRVMEIKTTLQKLSGRNGSLLPEPGVCYR